MFLISYILLKEFIVSKYVLNSETYVNLKHSTNNVGYVCLCR